MHVSHDGGGDVGSVWDTVLLVVALCLNNFMHKAYFLSACGNRYVPDVTLSPGGWNLRPRMVGDAHIGGLQHAPALSCQSRHQKVPAAN
jgi:hypothetical protein